MFSYTPTTYFIVNLRTITCMHTKIDTLLGSISDSIYTRLNPSQTRSKSLSVSIQAFTGYKSLLTYIDLG